ncbi:hypothetical protein Catovirus_1_383 [Catovirus CTV1]|uniref:Uncharacterized protein n=1 Tax=Catovirus CTV1 TaxID=1977631 RepID=A0A1V0S9F9_9VIRU|nr:hypothetical protein Catovirus_1_383 [Catovirus CTV1]
MDKIITLLCALTYAVIFTLYYLEITSYSGCLFFPIVYIGLSGFVVGLVIAKSIDLLTNVLRKLLESWNKPNDVNY